MKSVMKLGLFVTFLLLIASISEGAYTDGLTHYWSLDDANYSVDHSVNWVDSSYGDLTDTALTRSSYGYINEGWDFFPENSRATITNFDDTDVFTFKTWFNCSTGDKGSFLGREIFGAEYFSLRWNDDVDDYLYQYLKVDATTRTHFRSTNSIKNTYCDGNWHYFVYEKSASTCLVSNYKIYIDNTSIALTTITEDGAGKTCDLLDGQDMYIGYYHSDPYSFEGNLDEIGFWNRTLNQSERERGDNPFSGVSSPPPASGNKDGIGLWNFTNTSIGNSSISLSWNTDGNYSYSEIRNFTGFLLYNGTLNSTTISGLENNTFYYFNLTVYWNSTLTNWSWGNWTTNQTIQFRLNEIWAYDLLTQFEEAINMIWVVLLWIAITITALHYLTKNTALGIYLWYVGFSFDFLLIARIYETVTVTGGFTGLFYGLMYIGLAVWLLVKIFVPMFVRQKIKV